jgi:HEAT repeat protein
MLPLFLGGGDLASATRILVELNAIIDSNRLDADDRDEAMRLFRELSEPAVLTQLMRSLEHGAIDPTGAELGIFLKHLGPGAMPVLLAAIERTEKGPLQDRLRASIEGLAAANRPDLLTLLSRSDPDVVRGAARLAGQLRIAEAAGPLARHMTGPDTALRRVAVEALASIRSAPALEALQRALTDEDRDVRISAARGLASVRYPPARPRLEELLESRIVRDADLTEKLAFFEAYGSVATAESVATLDRMLNGRRLLGRETPEMRACAAMALGRMEAPAARAALDRAAGDNNPVVRNAVQRALRQERA